MERFTGRVFLIALCLSLAATGLQAGDKPVAHRGRGAVVNGATPVNTGTPATPATNEGSLRAGTDRLAEADSDSTDANDASAPDSTGSPAVAASADGPTTVANGPRAVGDQDLITMNFQNVDLPVLAKFISEITGKNFVLDENVRGRVSIISPTRVTPEQAYSIFQSVLQVKGFTTVQAGTIIKIIPSRDVRQSAELTQSQQPGTTQGDQYVTRMVKLRNTDATSVMSVIQPMISHDGLVAAFPQDNTLIITDDAYNVQRLLRIVGSLDVQGVQQNVAVIPLKLAFADDLAQQIEKIMTARENTMHGIGGGQFIRPGMGVVAPSAQGANTNFSIVADERTNSVVVLASPLEMRQIKDLIQRLDVHSPSETSRIHVYHLKYAPAGEMVDVLNGLLSGGGGPSSLSPTTGRNSLGRGGSGSTFGSGFGGGFGTGFGSGSSSSFGGGLSSFGGTNSSFGSSFGGSSTGSGFGGGMGGMGGMSRGGANTSGSTTASSNGGKGTIFENPVSVTADPATNSLVISAAPQDYETVHKVVEELDIPRVQVFVQAIIVEVSVGHSRDIGVAAFAPQFGNGSVMGVGTLNFGALQNALGNPLGLTGLGIGLSSGSNCTIPGALVGAATNAITAATSTANSININTNTGNNSSPITVPCEIALMTALQQDTHSNVLSAPTLLTADNEEATIVVGQNLPFVGSATATSALSGQIFNSVDRQNVGISLDFIPQVTEGDYIRLDVYEEVSNVVPSTTNQGTNPLGPTTTIRSASTSVLVQNHRTAVIGGLISTDVENQRQGIPFLSDIPVLGNLMSDTSRTAAKDNLLVFLTPHIIRTRDELQALALDERQKFIRSLGRKEVNDMPVSQFQQLYQPTFNAAVSPQENLMQSQQGAMPGGAGMGPAMGRMLQLGPSGNNATAP
ncbi:MAG: type II secretion system secretin GspD [Deltaproteobacteria bacterium]|nr:type II secretion system secretin GspD [Deltaproteobacteria bacterium]